MSVDVDHIAIELAPHGAKGGLGAAVARLVEQLAEAGARSRVFVPAGVLAAGRHAQAWGEVVALPVVGIGPARVASLTELALRERARLGAARVFVAHDHECAAAAVLAKREAASGERVVYWLHSLYDSPLPHELPDPLRGQLRRDDSLVAAALEIADLVVTSGGVLADARELDWPRRMQATRVALVAGAAHGCVLTVEADGCLPKSMVTPDGIAAERPRVVFAARPGVHKGAGVFIEIAAALAGEDVEFIGLGDPAAAGLDPRTPGVSRIRWLDWQTPQSLWSLVCSARCIVMPSITEGFGLAAAEVDALGVPSIYSDIGGLRSRPTSARATAIGLTPREREDLYRLWGDSIGTDTAGSWAAWARARRRFDSLIERWIEQVRHTVAAAQPNTEAPAPISTNWGPRLLAALAELGGDRRVPMLP